jgi:photosystem II stability/assembly factor-like uncharacterized protein
MKSSCKPLVISPLLMVVLCMICHAPSFSGQPPWKLLLTYPRECGQMAAATSPDGRHAVTIGWWGSMYFSRDSGQTWKLKQTGIFEPFESVAYYSETGIAIPVSSGAVLLSDDEFQTWTRVTVDASDSLTRLRRVKHNTMLCVSRDGVVYRSSDGGRSWSAVYRGTTPLYDVAVSRDGRAIAVGSRGTVLMSRDTGVTWTPTPGRGPDTIRLLLAAFVRDSIWMIAGDTTYLARSTDNGATWSKREPIPSLTGRRFTVRSLAFNDYGDGLLLHRNMFNPDGYLSITRDGGDTWDRARASNIIGTDAMFMTDIAFFPNTVTGIISGVIIERLSWIRLWEQGSWLDRFCKECRYKDSNDYAPLFYTPTKYGTYLLGRDHQKVQMVTEYSPDDDQPIRQWKQNDSSSWRQQDSGAQESYSKNWKYRGADKLSDRQMVIYADSISNASTSADYFGRLLRTDDGGATWRVTKLDYFIYNPETLWKSTMDGVIEHAWIRGHASTSDGGLTWRKQLWSFLYDTILLLCVTDDSTGYLGVGVRSGDGQTDLMRSSDGLEWSVLLADIPKGRRVLKNGRFMLILARDAVYGVDIAADGSWAKLTRRCDSDGIDAGDDGLSCFANDILVTMRSGGSMMMSMDSGCSMIGRLRDPLLDYLYVNRMSVLNRLFAFNNVVYLAFGKGQIAKGVVNATTTGIEDHGDVLTNPPFPNPARNRVSIRVGWFVTVAPSVITLKVYNSLGQEVRDLTTELRSRVDGLSSTVTIDISDLPPGVYYAVTRAGRDLSTQQIMVQR